MTLDHFFEKKKLLILSKCTYLKGLTSIVSTHKYKLCLKALFR